LNCVHAQGAIALNRVGRDAPTNYSRVCSMPHTISFICSNRNGFAKKFLKKEFGAGLL
jgi:hypothetical protein